MKYWSEVTPDMMSDEEKDGETYFRHQPSFRSTRFNNFIEKLDERIEKMPTSHPRHTRILGSPVEMATPKNAKPWMIKNNAALSIPNEEYTSGSESEIAD